MTRSEKCLMAGSVAAAILLGVVPAAGAMHIMEGFLDAGWCIGWYAMCIPFFIWGCISIRKTVKANPKTKLILAMCGAYIFVLSALKLPSVTGSSSHPTGTGLAAILFGPAAVCVLGLIVLLFQAILLAHGGLTTLGANTFSMAIAGPFAGFGVYKLLQKCRAPKSVAVFFGAFAADLFTYVVTAVQLAAAHPAQDGGFAVSLVKFLGVFAVTQVPLAIIEGILCVLVVKALDSVAQTEMSVLMDYPAAYRRTAK